MGSTAGNSWGHTRRRRRCWGLTILALLFMAGGCATTAPPVPPDALPRQDAPGPPPAARTPAQLYAELAVLEDMIPLGTLGRSNPLPMKPRYITIHSTQNPTGDAYAHALALKRGNLRGGRRTGYLFWHYTVQDSMVIQHLPTYEAGEHADRDGPGNRFSIGIEMCEHYGNNRAQTIERTAKLAAWLMVMHAIPLSNVVPHYHWPRVGYNPPNKNCPHFLLENGQPGVKWQGFLERVQGYYQQMTGGRMA